jgi:hypothetical protein
MSAGDYRLFRSENVQNRSPETGGQFAKARHWRAFLRVSGTFSLITGLPGWGGRIRTSAWWNQKPLPYRWSAATIPSGSRSEDCRLTSTMLRISDTWAAATVKIRLKPPADQRVRAVFFHVEIGSNNVPRQEKMA